MDNEISDKLMELISSLSSEQLQLVLETLTDLGVETWNDLRHVKESDFQTVLKPVHARKLISSWNTVDKGDQPSCSSTERVSSSTSSNASSADDWDFCFQIPWDLFPQDLLDACKEGQRPLHRDRLQMIRIIVEEVHKTARNIKKKELGKDCRIHGTKVSRIIQRRGRWTGYWYWYPIAGIAAYVPFRKH